MVQLDTKFGHAGAGDGMCYLAGTEAGVCHFSRKAGDRDRIAGVRIGKKILLNLVEINLAKFKCIQPSLSPILEIICH